jgi:hypothetical protein
MRLRRRSPSLTADLLAALRDAINDLNAGRAADVPALRRLQAEALAVFDVPEVHAYPADAYEASRRLAAVVVRLGRAVDAIEAGDVLAAEDAMRAAFTRTFATSEDGA